MVVRSQTSTPRPTLDQRRAALRYRRSSQGRPSGLRAIDTLILAGQESFATSGSFYRNGRAIANGASTLRVVQNCHAQLNTIRMGQEQRAKITPGDAQQICGECLRD
jgi:hypothetical protein